MFFFFDLVSIPIVTALLLKIFSPKILLVAKTFPVVMLPLDHTAKFLCHFPERTEDFLIKSFNKLTTLLLYINQYILNIYL